MSQPLPEPYRSFSNLDLLRAIAHESDQAKQLLRNAGFGVTGMGLLETVKEVLAEVDCNRELDPAGGEPFYHDRPIVEGNPS